MCIYVYNLVFEGFYKTFAWGMYHGQDRRCRGGGAHCLGIGFRHVFSVPAVPHLLMHASRDRVLEYRNDPKFSDRHAWANSADPDQIDPRGGAVSSGSTLLRRSSLISFYTVCHSVCIGWTHRSMVGPHSSNFRVIITNVFGCPNI